MAKMLNALLLIVIINVGLFMLTKTAVPGSALWSLIQNPTNWSQLSFLSYLSDVMAIIGVGTIVIGSFFIKSDFLIFAGISTVFLSFGASLFSLWQYINSHAALNSGPQGWVAIIFISPIVLMYIYAILAFWRGTD